MVPMRVVPPHPPPPVIMKIRTILHEVRTDVLVYV